MKKKNMNFLFNASFLIFPRNDGRDSEISPWQLVCNEPIEVSVRTNKDKLPLRLSNQIRIYSLRKNQKTGTIGTEKKKFKKNEATFSLFIVGIFFSKIRNRIVLFLMLINTIKKSSHKLFLSFRR